jgi:hypothetical protein
MADAAIMYTVYAIDREGHEHEAPGGDCATLEEALGCLDDLAYEGSLDSEPDDPFFVRYGMTFTHDGVADIAERLVRHTAPHAAPRPCAP